MFFFFIIYTSIRLNSQYSISYFIFFPLSPLFFLSSHLPTHHNNAAAISTFPVFTCLVLDLLNFSSLFPLTVPVLATPPHSLFLFFYISHSHVSSPRAFVQPFLLSLIPTIYSKIYIQFSMSVLFKVLMTSLISFL